MMSYISTIPEDTVFGPLAKPSCSVSSQGLSHVLQHLQTAPPYNYPFLASCTQETQDIKELE